MTEESTKGKIADLRVYMPAGLPKRYVGTDLANSIIEVIKQDGWKPPRKERKDAGKKRFVDYSRV
jgi:hypothetical protein